MKEGDVTGDDIQSLIDALPPKTSTWSGGGTVTVPPGEYEFTRPLRISRSNVTLLGDPAKTTRFYGPSMGIPVILVGPNLVEPVRLFRGGMDTWVNLRDLYSGEYAGAKSLSISWKLPLDELPPDGSERIIACCGGNYAGLPREETLRVSVYNGMLRGMLSVGGVKYPVAIPTAAGDPTPCSFSYDGSEVAITQGPCSNSVQASGQVDQGIYQDFTVGADLARWPDNVAQTPSAKGVMTDFSFVASLPNGDCRIDIPSFVPDAFDQCIAVTCAAPYVGTGKARLFVRKAGAQTSVNHVRVEDITIDAGHGVGLLVTNVQNSIFRGLNLGLCRTGVMAWNNAYRNVWESLYIEAVADKGRYGLGLIANGVLSRVVDLQVLSSSVGVVCNSGGGTFQDAFAYDGRIGFLANGDWESVFLPEFATGDEGQSIVPECGILLGKGVATCNVVGGGSVYLTYPAPAVRILDTATEFTADGMLTGKLHNPVIDFPAYQPDKDKPNYQPISPEDRVHLRGCRQIGPGPDAPWLRPAVGAPPPQLIEGDRP